MEYNIFFKYCPIIYLHSKEPYMPIRFDDLINGQKYKSTRLIYQNESDNVNMNTDDTDNINVKMYDYDKFDHGVLNQICELPINEQTKYLIDINADTKCVNVPISNQIQCFTKGKYKFQNANDEYIDIFYVTIYGWNGTLAYHAFDVEYIVCSINLTQEKVIRVYGSSHGNGMWYDKEIEYEGTRPIIYAGFESHAMYPRIGTIKRIFGFGNDYLEKGIRYDPNEIILLACKNNIYTPENPKYGSHYILLTKQMPLCSDISCIIVKEVYAPYFYFGGVIGSYSNNQTWITNIDWDIMNLDGWFKFEGGFANLFEGRLIKIKYAFQNILLIIGILLWCILLWTLFSNFVFNSSITYKNQNLNNYNIIYKIVLSLIIIISSLIFFITTFYIGLKIFVLN